MNQDKKIVGIGYNGMPNGCSDDNLPWSREADEKLDTKYPYGKFISHYNKNSKLHGIGNCVVILEMNAC